MDDWDAWVHAAKLVRAHGDLATGYLDEQIVSLREGGQLTECAQLECVRQRVEDLQLQEVRWLS
jgi:hypothetical protein